MRGLRMKMKAMKKINQAVKAKPLTAYLRNKGETAEKGIGE